MIDDFGLMELDLDKYRDLFEVLDTRDGRKSTVGISQFLASTWFDMFADNTYADACLTCITNKHHMCRLEMNGINCVTNQKMSVFFPIVAAYIRSMIFAVNSPSLYVKLLAPPFFSVIWRMD